MAYIFLLENDNEIVASHREVLMQRSKLVDEVWFLVNPKYKINENNMSDFSVVMEYILPASKAYHSLELIEDREGYKEYLKYVVPLDSNLSSEAGDIQLQLSFVYAGLDADGKSVQKVRKTRPAKLHITSVAAWGDIIPDAALSSIDQRIIKTQAQIKELGYLAEILNENQVDSLTYDEKSDSLQLMSGDKGVGDKVAIKNIIRDGIPVVDLDSNGDSSSNTKPEGDCDCGCEHEDNVVEFGDSDIIEKLEDDNVVEF